MTQERNNEIEVYLYSLISTAGISVTINITTLTIIFHHGHRFRFLCPFKGVDAIRTKTIIMLSLNFLAVEKNYIYLSNNICMRTCIGLFTPNFSQYKVK